MSWSVRDVVVVFGLLAVFGFVAICTTRHRAKCPHCGLIASHDVIHHHHCGGRRAKQTID